MSKIKISAICILVVILTIIIFSQIMKNVIWKKAHFKEHTTIIRIYSDFMYSLTNNKEETMRKVASEIVGNDIIGIQKYNMDINQYSFLCPYLNKPFKKSILDSYGEYSTKNSRKTINEFEESYQKLKQYCDNNK